MLSDENLKMLESRKTTYIVGARLKSMDANMKEAITDKSRYKPTDIEGEKQVAFDLDEGKRLIVTYSLKRAAKDRYDREKTIEKLKKKLERSSNPSTLISNYGYKKYLQLTGNSIIEINERKLSESSKWDGLHGIITNTKELSDAEAKDHYHKLWQIEESFRISKHDLSIRPIYHWMPQRIKAHIAICFMALVCLRHLEYRVKTQYEKLSPEVIRNELLHVQCSVLRDKLTGKRYSIPSSLTKHIKKIYQIIGQKINSIPFELV